MYWNPSSLDGDDINLFQEIQLYKSSFSNYAGNCYTYYVFKQLIKLFLTEVYLYKYKNSLLTYKELMYYSQLYIMDHPEPNSIKSISQMIESGEVQKIKYHCIKVLEPLDITYFPIYHLNLYLIDVNKLRNFEDSYNTLIVKSFKSFLNYDLELQNKEFLANLNNSKKNIKIN